MTAFSITRNKGFACTFANGYTVSIQFGPENYCQNYGAGWDSTPKGGASSEDCETALIGPTGEFIAYHGGEVQARRSPAEVLALLNHAASL